MACSSIQLRSEFPPVEVHRISTLLGPELTNPCSAMVVGEAASVMLWVSSVPAASLTSVQLSEVAALPGEGTADALALKRKSPPGKLVSEATFWLGVLT